MIRVLTVLGTRPEAIKLAPVIHALEDNTETESIVCVTGQHRELLEPMLKFFNIKTNYNLDVMHKNQALSDITSDVLLKLKPILENEKPDLVLVQGDTSTTFSAALAAYYQGIPVAHVEAGLRSYNLHSPFPEEANRRFVSSIARWHFAPTNTARQNLISERIQPEQVHVTGNTVIDSLLWTKDRVIGKNFSGVYGSAEEVLHSGLPIILVTGHRRESFGEGFEQLCKALSHLAKKHHEWHFVYPVHLNPNVQSPVYDNLSDIHNIHLIQPLVYETFVQLMNRAKLIITDSGGIQEEAPSLGKPVLVTRDVTERTESVEAGSSVLVGMNFDRIVSETESIMLDDLRYAKMVGVRNPYGDGDSAKRIVQILVDDFKVSDA